MSGKKIWAILIMLVGASTTVAGGVIIAEGIIKFIQSQRHEHRKSHDEQRSQVRDAAE
jgi:hypothetical protein